MEVITLTNRQARQFILLKQGLLGEYRFEGKDGVLDYIRQAGCIQFDPIDVCGKNAELVLQSRVKGFSKKLLYELLYEDRKLIDYFDKNLAIIPVEDWPYFERVREENRQSGRGREEVDQIAEEIKEIIAKRGPVCSKDLDFQEKVDWYWNRTKLARAALETLYFRGDLIIHHKKGTNKYYALARDYIAKELLDSKDPLPEDIEHLAWRVLRRISTVGLLWNKPSDAWLFIWGLKAEQRGMVFHRLLQEGRILPVQVEGCKELLYCLSDDLPLLEEVQTGKSFPERTELLAALDNMLWDRKLVKELFQFDYKWEIYTPQEQRKYGYYVLPILKGESLIGRCEAIADTKQKALVVRNIWLEPGIRKTKKLWLELERCFLRFMSFHGQQELIYSDNLDWRTSVK